VRFLERNGLDVKYYGCIDSGGDAAGTHLIGNGSTRGGANAGIFVGHNEYWSNSMRAGWEAARNAGVSIFSCAGNEVFWRTVGTDALAPATSIRPSRSSSRTSLKPGLVEPGPRRHRPPHRKPPSHPGRGECGERHHGNRS
jgi:hypothetical protein